MTLQEIIAQKMASQSNNAAQQPKVNTVNADTLKKSSDSGY